MLQLGLDAALPAWLSRDHCSRAVQTPARDKRKEQGNTSSPVAQQGSAGPSTRSALQNRSVPIKAPKRMDSEAGLGQRSHSLLSGWGLLALCPITCEEHVCDVDTRPAGTSARLPAVAWEWVTGQGPSTLLLSYGCLRVRGAAKAPLVPFTSGRGERGVFLPVPACPALLGLLHPRSGCTARGAVFPKALGGRDRMKPGCCLHLDAAGGRWCQALADSSHSQSSLPSCQMAKCTDPGRRLLPASSQKS